MGAIEVYMGQMPWKKWITLHPGRQHSIDKKSQYQKDYEQAYEELDKEFPGFEIDFITPSRGGTGEIDPRYIPTGNRGTG